MTTTYLYITVKPTSSNVHSDFDVGLDSGKMSGRELFAAMARTTPSVKACDHRVG